jgi:CheY-like chemotaxis protein
MEFCRCKTAALLKGSKQPKMKDQERKTDLVTDPSAVKDRSILNGKSKKQDCPPILLASDNLRVPDSIQRILEAAGFIVQLAAGYHELEPLWQKHRQDVVLLEVSGPQSVEAAVDTAIRLKTLDAHQFVGYVADPVLRAIGLDGDAIFPPTLHRLPKALRDYFCPELT